LPDKKAEFEKLLHSINQPFNNLGTVGGSTLKINNDINVKIENLADLYFSTISRIMAGEK